jgi:SAM-dependent methyltransferase
MPDPADLDHFYNNEYGRHDIEVEYSERHKPALEQLNEDFKRLLKLDRVRFHDDGCGYGHAVWHLNRAGANATGTDLSERSISLGRARGNTAISAETASQFLSRRRERVNALLMIHCLEHTYYPLDTMRHVRAVLADRGAALIFVPNVEYLPVLRHGITADPHFLFPAHLHYFSVQSLRKLFTASGFKILELGTTASFDFAPNMADEMLRSAVGRSAVDLKDPAALLQSFVANNLSYEIKALITRDDSSYFADWPGF